MFVGGVVEGEEFEEDAAERPDVRLVRIILAVQHLGRHIPFRPCKIVLSVIVFIRWGPITPMIGLMSFVTITYPAGTVPAGRAESLRHLGECCETRERVLRERERERERKRKRKKERDSVYMGVYPQEGT